MMNEVVFLRITITMEIIRVLKIGLSVSTSLIAITQNPEIIFDPGGTYSSRTSQDPSCWSCRRTRHRQIRSRKPLNPGLIAVEMPNSLTREIIAATLASVYSTNWYKGFKTSSTSSQLTPKLLPPITLVMHPIRFLILNPSLSTPGWSSLGSWSASRRRCTRILWLILRY